MVLATDEVYTYAIFNYINLVWSSHTEAGGDTTGGEGGVPAFVSFFFSSDQSFDCREKLIFFARVDWIQCWQRNSSIRIQTV